MTVDSPGRWSVRDAAGAGVAVGCGVLALYLAGGLVFASWSIAEFVSYLSPDAVLYLALAGVGVVGTFAVPVSVFLWARYVSPLAVLGVVLVAWVLLGVSTGALFDAPFGIGLYALLLAPLYLVLYAVVGGGEYYVRRKPGGAR